MKLRGPVQGSAWDLHSMCIPVALSKKTWLVQGVNLRTNGCFQNEIILMKRGDYQTSKHVRGEAPYTPKRPPWNHERIKKKKQYCSVTSLIQTPIAGLCRENINVSFMTAASSCPCRGIFQETLVTLPGSNPAEQLGTGKDLPPEESLNEANYS